MPISFDLSPSTGVFHLVYVPDHRSTRPRSSSCPTAIHYPHGYCARTTGARVTSAAGSDLLQLRNAKAGHRVTVVVTPGDCTGR